MFDVSLDLTRYLIFWSILSAIGFLGTFSIAILLYKKRKVTSKKTRLYYFLLCFILSTLIGIVLFVMVMNGFFDGILNLPLFI